MSSIKILGTGSFAPALTVTNNDYTSFVETSDEWIRTRTGMETRHIAVDEPTWYLGAKAAEQAVANAGISRDDIGMVLVTTVTPDYYTPSTACLIQEYLGIKNAMTVDINVACTAFSFALDMAKRYLATGDINNVLLVSTEELSQLTNYNDRSTCVLFGDGAGAVVLSKSEGVYGTFQNTDSSGMQYLYARIPRKSHPFATETSTKKYDPFDEEVVDYFSMQGQEVYKFATRAMPEAIVKACDQAGIALDELDMVFPHQANLRIVTTAIKNLKMDSDKFFVNIEKYGNTSSASSSIALHEAAESGRIKRGDKICVVGFGAGLTYGATVFEY